MDEEEDREKGEREGRRERGRKEKAREKEEHGYMRGRPTYLYYLQAPSV